MIAATPTVTVAHRLPGRVRLRLPRSHRLPALLARVRKALLALPGVSHVETAVTTGSVLVEHDRDRTSLAMIGSAVEAAGGLPLEVPPSAEPATGPSINGRRPLVGAVIRTTSALNAGVRQATAGLLDLKLLVPLALAGVALLQINRDGGSLLGPPYTMLWYAFSIFMTFNVK